jgi:hypothetical protein
MLFVQLCLLLEKEPRVLTISASCFDFFPGSKDSATNSEVLQNNLSIEEDKAQES